MIIMRSVAVYESRNKTCRSQIEEYTNSSDKPAVTMADQIMESTPGASGVVITMNAFIDPAKKDEYVKYARVVEKQFVASPENIFCAISVNPTNAGHIRIVHGWKKDSTWWVEVRLGHHSKASSVNMDITELVVQTLL
jgi:hypothetical protein